MKVVNDPAFGADEVRAVPRRDRDGNIVGVALQVGPNARAIDIQLHVDTVDAMRRYVGLSGRVRMFMNRIGRGLGMDIVDPSQMGRWEAALEVAKLPRIIGERIARLSEHGLDPRRRALVLEEIANLERQFLSEVARFDQGAAAEARGFVAAQSQGDLDTTSPRRQDADTDEAQRPPLSDEDRAELSSILVDIRTNYQAMLDADRAIQGSVTSEVQGAPQQIKKRQFNFLEALRELRRRNPNFAREHLRNLPESSRGLGNQAEFAALYAQIAGTEGFSAALASLGYRDRQRIEGIAPFLDIVRQRQEALDTHERVKSDLSAEIAALQERYRDLAGNTFMDVVLHPDLPERRAEVDAPGYLPELAFQRRFEEQLGETRGKALMKAILARINGDDGPMSEFAQRRDLAEILEILSEGKKNDKSLDSIYDQVIAHREGYRAELALASQIAGGIGDLDWLPGDRTKQVVIDYGDPIGRNNADVLSVDAEGNVFLWDSKFHGDATTGGDSPTFATEGKREAARKAALRILENDDRTGALSAEARDAAIANLKAGTFHAVTSHTSGDLSTFTHSVLAYVNGESQE